MKTLITLLLLIACFSNVEAKPRPKNRNVSVNIYTKSEINKIGRIMDKKLNRKNNKRINRFQIWH